MNYDKHDAIKLLQLQELAPDDSGHLVLDYCGVPELKEMVLKAKLKHPEAVKDAIWEGDITFHTYVRMVEDTSTGRDTPDIPDVKEVVKFPRQSLEKAAGMSWEMANKRKPAAKRPGRER